MCAFKACVCLLIIYFFWLLWMEEFVVKEHKKMYKSGKHWAVATLTAVTFAGVIAATQLPVHADDSDIPVVTDVQNKDSSVIKSDNGLNQTKNDEQVNNKSMDSADKKSESGLQNQLSASTNKNRDTITYEDKSVVRWINLYLPNRGSEESNSQSVSYTRRVVTHEDGSRTYGNWELSGSDTLERFNLPHYDGYLAMHNGEVINYVPEEVVSLDSNGNFNIFGPDVTYSDSEIIRIDYEVNYVPVMTTERKSIYRSIRLMECVDDGNGHYRETGNELGGRTQEVNYERSVKLNEDGSKTYGEWHLSQGSPSEWKQLDVPHIDGYLAVYKDKFIPEEPVSPEDEIITVDYVPEVTTEKKEITRTIIVKNYPYSSPSFDGTDFNKPIKQTVTYIRSVKLNEDGSRTYSDWKLYGYSKKNWEELPLTYSGFDNHVAQIKENGKYVDFIPEKEVSPNDHDEVINVDYSYVEPKRQQVTRTINITYPDGKKNTINQVAYYKTWVHANNDGKLVTEWVEDSSKSSEGIVSYQPGGPDVEGIALERYDLPLYKDYVAMWDNREISLIPQEQIDENTPDQTIDVVYVSTKQDTKDSTRTILITFPDGKQRTISQTVRFVRPINTQPDGTKTYGTWKMAAGPVDWESYILPTYDNYYAEVNGNEHISQIPEQAVDSNTNNQTLLISYIPIHSTPASDSSTATSTATPASDSSTATSTATPASDSSTATSTATPASDSSTATSTATPASDSSTATSTATPASDSSTATSTATLASDSSTATSTATPASDSSTATSTLMLNGIGNQLTNNSSDGSGDLDVWNSMRTHSENELPQTGDNLGLSISGIGIMMSMFGLALKKKRR